MSLLVNNTRYVGNASEAVDKARCIGTWWSGRFTTAWRLHNIAFWFVPNKSAQTVSGDVAPKRLRNFLSLFEVSLDFPQSFQDTSGLVLQDLLWCFFSFFCSLEVFNFLNLIVAICTTRFNLLAPEFYI
jgi:hypothetical protein